MSADKKKTPDECTINFKSNLYGVKETDQDQDKEQLAYHARKKDDTDMDTETFSRKLSDWTGLDVSRRHTVAAVVHFSNTNNKERNSQPGSADTCKSSLPPVET